MNSICFRDETVTFATKHGKASAASEHFGAILNTKVEQLVIDSDRLGTFSGEIERPGSMLDALRGKVKLARELTPSRFVLVSEGSFGSADGLGFVPQGIEMLLLHDAHSGVEVIEQHISSNTNYATATLATEEDLRRFAQRISFGSHALVLYPDGASLKYGVHKGITSMEDALRLFESCRLSSPLAKVAAMSDMRAHMNPTRMRAISACCELLAHRLATLCPRCGSGGFGLVASIPGLPCEWCGSPTRRARAERHSCVVCSANLERPRADGKSVADPSECDQCNP